MMGCMKRTEAETIPIHPAADVFPMLPEDELQELAEDIKHNGLRESIKTHKGLLIDGRNRLAACQIAGVDAQIEELNGATDPVAYILSANINRRHLTKGQRAMAVAMIYPEPEKGGRGKRAQNRAGFDERPGDRNLLGQARTVLAVLPELAAQVRDGTTTLSEGYAKAQLEHKATEGAEQSVQSLRKQAPDLAELVDEERMRLQEALAALDKRKREERNQREALYGLLEKQQVFAPTLEGPQLKNLITTITAYPEECSLKETKKLANRLATGWRNLAEAL
jgi:hypothetical protein